MRKLYLHGKLKERFGGPFKLQARNAREACRLLAVQIPGFERELSRGTYRVIVGPLRGGKELSPDQVTFNFSSQGNIHIIPVARGAKGGAFKIVAGLLMVAAVVVTAGAAAVAEAGVAAAGDGLAVGSSSIVGAGLSSSAMAGTFSIAGLSVSYGSLAQIGALMAVSGLAQVLSPHPKVKDYTQGKASFLYNGPVNTANQGQPIPVAYGRIMVGSILVNTLVDVVDLNPWDDSDTQRWADIHAAALGLAPSPPPPPPPPLPPPGTGLDPNNTN